MIYIAVFFAILIMLCIAWHLMVRSARRFYERIRDNADIETEQELITYCNLALDEVNRQHRFLRWLFR